LNRLLDRIRLLPVVVVVAALLLALRVGSFGVAVAQQTPSTRPVPSAPAPRPRPVQLAQAPAAPAETPANAPAADATEGEKPAEPARVPPGRTDAEGERVFSPGEIETLQDLAKRREELDRWAAELDQRDAILQAAERRIQQQVDELKKLQAGVESALARYDEQEQARRNSLIRMFQNMKPAEAARIFEQMELPTLVELVEAMNERRAAPILAQMNPIRAQQVTAEIARRKQPENVPPSRIPGRTG
jgi:flagellar motility protein MotE (MotC chaperone)